MTRFSSSLFILFRLTSAYASFCSLSEGWSVVFEDNFDDGTTLDETNWNIAEYDAGASSYCRSASCNKDNVYIEDGNLVIKSDGQREDSSQNWTNLTSGAVTTRNKQTWNPSEQTFRVCINAALPGYDSSSSNGGGGQGIWPAHWLMPNDSSCDPDEGEMDILEMINGDGNSYSTYHWQDTYPQQNCSYPQGHLQASGDIKLENWGENFHEYAVERSSSSLVFSIDETISLNSSNPNEWPSTYNGEDTTNPLFWNVDWYLILNTAVGGGWPGEPDENTIFPTYHRIDSVKVIVKNGEDI